MQHNGCQPNLQTNLKHPSYHLTRKNIKVIQKVIQKVNKKRSFFKILFFWKTYFLAESHACCGTFYSRTIE
jgi:hypothetical protein